MIDDTERKLSFLTQAEQHALTQFDDRWRTANDMAAAGRATPTHQTNKRLQELGLLRIEAYIGTSMYKLTGIGLSVKDRIIEQNLVKL